MNPNSHIDSGSECLRGHYNYETGEQENACIKCSLCRVWIRPQNMSDDCPEITMGPIQTPSIPKGALIITKTKIPYDDNEVSTHCIYD